MFAVLSHANFTFLSHDNALLLRHIALFIGFLGIFGWLAKSHLQRAAALGNARAQACLILIPLLIFGGMTLLFMGNVLDDHESVWERITSSAVVALYLYQANKKAARQQFILMLRGFFGPVHS